MSAVLDRMDTLVSEWGSTDRRSLFANAYRAMSVTTLEAIASDEFDDSVWVDHLLSNFADYYFHAVDSFEGRAADPCPDVWKLAFDATSNDDIHPLRVLFLGINAHINYDLALCVADVMGDWAVLDREHQRIRRTDYERVDEIILRTVDMVQDNVVSPSSPAMALMDKLLGPVDEWLFTALIANWRRDTWSDALTLLDSPEDQLAQTRANIESEALDTADWIIHVGPE